MTTLKLAQAILSIAALAWMLYQLARRPRDIRLRCVTALVAGWTIGYPFGLAAVHGWYFLGVEPMVSQLIQNSLLLLAAYSLICFYLYSALDEHEAGVSARWQAIPLATAVLVLISATALIPEELRTVAAAMPSSNGKGPVSVFGIALFYLTANSYMLYAFTTSLVLTRRYARGAEPRLRRGMGVASAGLAAMVIGLATVVTQNAARWAGGALPGAVIVAGSLVLLLGILLFLVGVSYPAAVMRLAALQVWWRHRRTYRHLGPLWTLLHAEFPEDALNRTAVTPWSEALNLRGVHRRYYRRVIECRDGLVRLSPYLARLGPNGDSAGLASGIKDALRAHAAREPVPPRPVPVAIPAADGLDADVCELVALSLALR